MAQRVPSDHPTVETVRARVERHGGRHRLTVPSSVLPNEESVIQVVVDERTRFASVRPIGDEERWLTGLYDTHRSAEEGGDDRLGRWLDENDRQAGSSVEFDIVAEGRTYGIRPPGETAIYRIADAPDAGLAAIARDLEDAEE